MEYRRPRRRGLWRIPGLGDLALAIWRWDARRKLAWIESTLGAPDPACRLIEIGAGPGTLHEALQARGYRVEAFDVRDGGYREGLTPTLYDGRSLPAPDDAYDVGLLFTVLHHTPDPDAVLREALRVAPRVLVLEDVFRSKVQEKLTHWGDSLINLEFRGHPHSNRTTPAWLRTFERLDAEGQVAAEGRIAGYFEQVLFDVRRRS